MVIRGNPVARPTLTLRSSVRPAPVQPPLQLVSVRLEFPTARRRPPSRHTAEQRDDPAVHGVVRWRLIDLAQWIFEEFRITIAKQTLSRELRAMGYRKLSARPRHHAQAQGAI